MALGSKKQRQPRSKVLPAPPSGIETPYANCRLEWKGVGLGEKTRVVLDSPAWRQVMLPALLELEAERPRKGPQPSYTSEELERAVLFQKLAGVENYRQARNLLASDRHEETRRLLGFDRPRTRRGKNKTVFKSLDGVPSEVTVWRHEQRWGLARHIAIYERLFQLLLREHLEDPEFQQEARVLNVDGSVVRSHYTSFERVDGMTGEVKPPTLEGGGYMPRNESNAGKDGHGFNMVSVTTPTGLPLAYRIVPLATKDHSEADTALALFREEWREHVAPHLDENLRVLTADSAYKPGELREELRGLGIVENCHAVSHGKSRTNKENAVKHDAMVFQIQDYPNWRANGHRELSCLCGQGKTVPRVKRHESGRAVVRVEGDCKTCGSITITSGKWRTAQNPRRFVRCLPGEEEQADWLFGNPFTFHDKRAKAFGRARFGHGEGFHGHLLSRFGLLKHKAWYRRREEAQLDFLMVFCSMHALAIEQRKRAKQAARARAPEAAGAGQAPTLVAA